MRALALLLWFPITAQAQLADGGVTIVTGARNRLPGSSSMRGAEAQETPLVEHDAAKAVQTLPGVGRVAPGSSELVLWGAAPKDSRIEIDGIEVPALFHFGGYRSVLSTAMVGRLELEPITVKPDVGRGLGGVVRVETTQPSAGVHGAVSTDLSDTSGYASVAGDVGSLAGAARVSTLRAVVSPFLKGAAADRFALPQSWDAQLRGAWNVTSRDELGLLGLASSDVLSLEVSSDDPTLARGRRESSESYRLGLSWKRGEATEGFTLAAFGGLDRRSTSLSTPLSSAYARNQAWVGGLDARWRASLDEGIAATCGFDGLLTRSGLERSGPLTLPTREGDVTAFGEPLSDARAVDAWSSTAIDAAVFAGFDFTWRRFSISPALRLAAIASDVSRRTPRVAATPAIGLSTLEFALEPRLTASWIPLDGVTFTAAAGLNHQAADANDRSAVFGTPDLLISRGASAVAGVSVNPARGVWVEATGFFRASSALATRDPEVLARLAQLLIQGGEGRAFGGNFAGRLAWRGLNASLTYTLGRSERRQDASHPWRLADFDQTHVLTGMASYQWEGWRVGGRLRWATGLPRSPVVASSFDVRRGIYEPSFGAQNSVRLPDFVQLDLEASKKFTWGRWWLEIFLEVLNVTNRQNVEEWAYDSTFSRRVELTGLPLFGTLGLRGGF